MDNEKIQELLIQLLSDMSYVKAKLDNIEAQNISNRIDHLEATVNAHEKTIKSLENRASTMEQFTRNNMMEAKKQQTQTFISMGMAIFSALVSFAIGMMK